LFGRTGILGKPVDHTAAIVDDGVSVDDVLKYKALRTLFVTFANKNYL
jgi:hypothetical protein